MTSGARHRVLIVDEFADAAITLADALTLLGHTCRAAIAREDVMPAFDEFQPTVVLVEWLSSLHIDSGVLRALLETVARRGVDVRIIVLSIQDPPEDFRFSRHVETYLAKPVASEQLHELLAGLPVPDVSDTQAN